MTDTRYQHFKVNIINFYITIQSKQWITFHNNQIVTKTNTTIKNGYVLLSVLLAKNDKG